MANDSIGALWLKKTEKATFMTGSLVVDGKKVDILVFKNKYKKEDKHPDYRILLAQPRGEQSNHDVNNDDIPF